MRNDYFSHDASVFISRNLYFLFLVSLSNHVNDNGLLVDFSIIWRNQFFIGGGGKTFSGGGRERQSKSH